VFAVDALPGFLAYAGMVLLILAPLYACVAWLMFA
jgi:hypothetical protein